MRTRVVHQYIPCNYIAIYFLQLLGNYDVTYVVIMKEFSALWSTFKI